jgi:hypothetical protein
MWTRRAVVMAEEKIQMKSRSGRRGERVVE